MEDLSAETSKGSSAARDAERRTGIRNSRFDVFCTDCWICIRAKSKHFTSYYRQIQVQDKTLLHGRWHWWNVTHDGCWTSCGWMKPTFHCIVAWIRKTVVTGRHQTPVRTTTSHCIFLMWLFGVVFTASFILGPFFFEENLSCIQQAHLYSLCRTVFYAFAWPRYACIAGKTCITCCHLHAKWCSALHCTRRQDVPVGIFH